MSENSRSGCVRYGCIGCLSLLALIVGLVFFAGAFRMIEPERDPSPETRRFEQVLPEPPPHPEVDGTILPPSDDIEIAESVELPEPAPRPTAGVLILDLEMGDFRITPGPSDQPLRVEADFDTSVFELREEYDEHPDGGWTSKVSFGSRRSFLGMLLSGRAESGGNEIEIVIPRGHPITIVGRIGLGESEMDLGGLWLERVDLELGAGDHFMEFSEPLPFPMEELALEASMGSVELRDLGEASPRSIQLKRDIGELYVDLSGHWRRDAEIVIDAGIGETRIDLPRDARVDVGRAGIAIGEKRIDTEEIEIRNAELPDDAPTLRLDVSGGIGEIRIED